MKIKTRTKALHGLVRKYFPDSLPPQPKNPTLALDDQTILERAMAAMNGDKFRRLWEGNISGYPSRSEADLALCCILAFHTGGDTEVTDRLFRQSRLFQRSKRLQGKWDKKHHADGSSYGRRTIQKAIAGMKTTTRKEQTDMSTKSEIQKLLAFAKDWALFKTSTGETFATIKNGNHNETHHLRSTAIKNYLIYQNVKMEGLSQNPTSIAMAVDTLAAMALHEGTSKEIFTRVAQDEDDLYIFLANDAYEAVKITADGWDVVSEYPVAFIKKPGMHPLPRPTREGSLKFMWDFLNINDKHSRILLLSWLVSAAFPTGPYPILVLQGEQGSAKSTAARFVRLVIDPNKSPIRSLSRSERDLAISAGNAHILAFDNVSDISPWLSDALCRLATGGGFSTRKLYSDTDEIILDLTRPVILNGIAFLPPAHDLVDRAILIDLAPIPDHKRHDEKEMMQAFEKTLPAILGALFDALSSALKNLPTVNNEGLPRMADFAKRIIAAEPALPWKNGAFMRAYQKNRDSAVLKSLEIDCVGNAIMALMKTRKKWNGTASALLIQLQGNGDKKGYIPEGLSKTKEWPKAPNTLVKRLKRASTFLKKVGIIVESSKRTATERRIVIRKG